jgi:hypothetical protein
MQGGKAFVDVLDEVLGSGAEVHVPGSAFQIPASGLRVATYPFLWFEQGLTAAQSPIADRPSPGAPPPPRRPAPTLSPKQQQALDVLVGLGAGIDADFTDDDLRRAFRGLARRYHPDRHPASSDGEKARLSRLFAQACHACEHLKSAARTTIH